MGFLKRAWSAFDDRVGVSSVFLPILKHPIPKGTGWAYVFGSAVLFAFITAVVSGIPLAAMYDTATGHAYDSLQWITHQAILGFQIRGIHFWASTAMLLLVGAHAIQVFLYGAYKFPREVNWMAGVILLFATAGIVFTGQVLRWDQYGVWTVAILDYQIDRVPIIGHVLAYIFLGGYTFNGTTLSRFFALHVFILPGVLFAFITAVASGIPLAAMYSSAAGSAYASLQWITHQAPLGALIRGIHFYAGTAMLLLVGAHALQTFLYGAYKYPREVNWMAGVILLFTTAGIMFTGQVLRWDQYGVWTVAILDYQIDRVPVIGHVLAYIFLGGYTFNGTTLSRFFALHVFVLPGVLFGIIGFHLYLVIHNGISEPPRAGRPVDPKTYKAWYKELLKRHGEPFFPDAAWRDVIAATVVLSAIVLLAAIVGPPALVGPPDPSNVAVQPRPDWYFLWYYAALALIPDASEPYVMILGPLIAIVGLIALPIIANKGERSFKRRPVAVAGSVGLVVFIIALTQAGAQAGWSPRFEQSPALSAQEIASTSAV